MKLSVVIPTLNEEAFVQKTIERIFINSSSDLEVIVIDTGSCDRTAQVLSTIPKVSVYVRADLMGKKYQALNYGASLSSGENILFLDADTLVPVGFDKKIKNEITRGTSGGAFRLKFDVSTTSLGVVRFFNEIRYRLTKGFFCDQGIFCSKEAFIKVGGFPLKPILAEVDMLSTLRKMGKIRLIEDPVVTSSRRFLKGGVWNVFSRDLNIYLRYVLGLPLEKKSRSYWQENARASQQSADI